MTQSTQDEPRSFDPPPSVIMRWVLLATFLAASARAEYLTANGDNFRSGFVVGQSSLHAALNSSALGAQWNVSVVGAVFAQPLVHAGVLLIVTMANRAYGFDAVSGEELWSRSLYYPDTNVTLPPQNSARDYPWCGDTKPLIGITGTPVIDPSTSTAYFVAKTYPFPGDDVINTADFYFQALDVLTGHDAPGFPLPVRATATNDPGSVFGAPQQMVALNQRAGLLLLDGVVYAAFGSFCDSGVWTGWVIGVGLNGGAIGTAWVVSHANQEAGGGIWQSGGGLASDGRGQILVTTGNGPNDAALPPWPDSSGPYPPRNLGDAVVRLQVQPDGSLVATDFFTPYNTLDLFNADADVSSSGIAVAPPPFVPPPFVGTLIASGKEGKVYLLDGTDLGGYQSGFNATDRVLSTLGPFGGVWSSPAIWPGSGPGHPPIAYITHVTEDPGTFFSAGPPPTNSDAAVIAYRYVLAPDARSPPPGLAEGWDPRAARPPRLAPALELAGATCPLAALPSGAAGNLTCGRPYRFASSRVAVTSGADDGNGPGLVWVIRLATPTGVFPVVAYLDVYDAEPPVDGLLVLRASFPVGQGAKFNPPTIDGGRAYVGTRTGDVFCFGQLG